jgi:hypothetical protein
MRIRIEDLLDLTTNLFNVASSGSSINTSFLKFSKNKMTTRSQEMFIEANLEHDIDDGLILFDKFQRLLLSFNPEKKVEIASEKDFIKIKHKDKGRVVAKIPFVQEDIEFPEIRKTKKWEKIPKDFFSALSFCRISLAKESINWILTYFGIFKDSLVTSDEKRCSQYPLSKPMKKNFVLSSMSSLLIENLDLKFYHVGEKNIEFKSDKYYVNIPLLVAEYPELKKEIFEKEVEIKINKTSFLNAIERCKIFASGDSERKEEIKIVFNKNQFEISSENDFGSSREKGTTRSKIKREIELRVNPNHMIDILKKTLGMNIVFYYSTNRLVFDQEKFKHVIALNV